MASEISLKHEEHFDRKTHGNNVYGKKTKTKGKVIETMPMTEKVEELLHVIGPFYEIVEDKKSGRSSDLISDKQMMKKSGEHKNLEVIVTNGYDKDSFIQEVQDGIQATSFLNGGSAEEVKPVEQNVEQTGKTAVCIHQDINDDHIEDVSGIQHLTSDSDSEVYCDSTEQFGQEESLDNFTLDIGPFHYYLGGDPTTPLENSGFPEDVQGPPGTGSIGTVQVVAVKGELKHGGEDGRSNSGAPPHEKRAGESEELSNVRRGRGHRVLHLSEGSRGRQATSGERRRRRALGLGQGPSRTPQRADCTGAHAAAGGHAERAAEAAPPGDPGRIASRIINIAV
ncbi:Acyl-CoA-binding domain-containing protein 5 [Heterocephalus glaber]|uniref:Acyl-CoA-binding domain-containing protein 5 n=1 Tax=Heterocephalus glaber TaxID=10181 RepID=G5BDL9_HETGA|nr:Acyl-CoA-binding domain-containing protein 5 [Heterocephalus glaber]